MRGHFSDVSDIKLLLSEVDSEHALHECPLFTWLRQVMKITLNIQVDVL